MHNSVLLPLYTFVVLELAFGGGPIARMLGSHPFTFLGGASYSLYILHLPLKSWLFGLVKRVYGHEVQGLGIVVAYTAVAVLLSSIVFKLVEEPLNRHLRNALSKLSHKVPELSESRQHLVFVEGGGRGSETGGLHKQPSFFRLVRSYFWGILTASDRYPRSERFRHLVMVCVLSVRSFPIRIWFLYRRLTADGRSPDRGAGHILLRPDQAPIQTSERVAMEAKYLSDVFELSLARPEFEPDDDAPVVNLKVARDDSRLLVNRCIDIVGATVGLIIMEPLMLVIAVVIKLTGSGPVLFTQERCGPNN